MAFSAAFFPSGSLALTVAHIGRTRRDQAQFNGDWAWLHSDLALCAILKGNEQILWPIQRMRLGPKDFQIF